MTALAVAPHPTPVVARQVQERRIARALERIHRGPCGAWHYDTDHRTRAKGCKACIRLGGAR